MLKASVIALLVSLAQSQGAVASSNVDSQTAEASPPPLQEIGRVRAVTPACAAMRDLVLPAYASILEVNKRNAALSDHIGNMAASGVSEHSAYLDSRPDEKSVDIVPEMYLSRAGQELSGMMQALERVSDILGRPPLNAASTDPAVRSERDALTGLYEIEAARIKVLSEVLLRKQVEINKKELKAVQDFSQARTDGGDKLYEVEIDTHAFEKPQLNPFSAYIAKKQMKAWTTGMAEQVAKAMNAETKKLLPIAQQCK